MDMGMDTGSDSTSQTCSMNMIGNWDTLGQCFLTSSWYISTNAQFAGTCIGVFLIVVMIETVRRWGREWDRYIIRRAIAQRDRRSLSSTCCESSASSAHSKVQDVEQDGKLTTPAGAATLDRLEQVFYGFPNRRRGTSKDIGPLMFRPSVIQQLVRSIVYGVQFTGAYIVMLIAMSYNGYILISIVIGAIVGHFVSTWDHLTMELPDKNVPAQIDVSDPYVLSSGGGGQSSGLVGSQVQSAITAKNAASADEAACYGESKGACCA